MTSLKLKFDRNTAITSIFAIWCVMSFTLPRLFDAHNSYDHSWMRALAIPGDNKAFSYGPLAWVFLPDLGAVSFIKIFIRFISSSILLSPFFVFFHRTTYQKKFFFFLGMLFLLAAPYFKYDVLFYLSFWFLVLGEDKKSPIILMTFLGWLIIAPIFKFSYLPLGMILVLAFALGNKPKLKWILGAGMLLVLGHVSLDSFFIAKLEFSLGYSEYMAAHQSGSEWLALSMLFLSLLLVVYFFTVFEKRLSVLLMASLFMQYKHGVVLGTPGYAFYLFFLPCYFFLLRFDGRWALGMTAFSLWMIPFHLSYMGGIGGLFEKFLNALILKPNVPVVVQADQNCASGDRRTLILDYFGEAITSPCEMKTFPSVQFYGFSPTSQVAKLNKDYLRKEVPEALHLSPLTFGKRNAISELSHLLPDLIENYSLKRGEILSSLQRRDTGLQLRCDSSIAPTKLALLELRCSDPMLESYQALIGLIYKYPEFSIQDGGEQNRVYYSALKSGVHTYLGDKGDIFQWWNVAGGIPQRAETEIVIEVNHSGGIFSAKIEQAINKCLEVTYCQIGPRTQK